MIYLADEFNAASLFKKIRCSALNQSLTGDRKSHWIRIKTSSKLSAHCVEFIVYLRVQLVNS